MKFRPSRNQETESSFQRRALRLKKWFLGGRCNCWVDGVGSTRSYLDPPKNTLTLPETNIAPENGWLEYYFPIGDACFQGRLPLVSGRVKQRSPQEVCSAGCLSLGMSRGKKKNSTSLKLRASLQLKMYGWSR